MSDFTPDDIAAASGMTDAPSEPVSSPGAPEASAPAPASATETPATPGSASAPLVSPQPPIASGPGPIPYDRHQEIVENQRRTAVDRARREWQQSFGVQNDDEVRQAIALRNWIHQDREGFIEYLSRVTKANQPVDPFSIEPDLTTTDGVPVYSAERMKEIVRGAIAREVEKVTGQIAPLHEAREMQEAKITAWNTAAQGIAQAQQHWPYFEELKPLILAHMRATHGLPMVDAYLMALKGTQAQREKKLRETLAAEAQSKRAGSSEAPTTPRSGTPKATKGRDVREIVAETYRELAASESRA